MELSKTGIRVRISDCRVKTVNLAKIASGFSGNPQVSSHYKRLQQFLREFAVDSSAIALMVVRVKQIPKPWIVSIDCTDWQLGKTVFNGLTLGVVSLGMDSVKWIL